MNTPFNINIYLANGSVEVQIDEQIDLAFHQQHDGLMAVIHNVSRAELKDLAGQLHYAWEKSAGIAKKRPSKDATEVASTTDAPCNIIADED